MYTTRLMMGYGKGCKMSWKQRNTPPWTKEKDPEINHLTMVEHSINPHKIQTKTGQQHVSNLPLHLVNDQYKNTRQSIWIKNHWNMARCICYQEELIKKGFVIGAKILTQYGSEGEIDRYREIPSTGIDFSGSDKPNMFLIKRPNIDLSNLLYNETELTLVQ